MWQPLPLRSSFLALSLIAMGACQRHQTGTGSGVTGAMQMGAGALGGSVIIAMGGAANFSIAMIGMATMSSISILSIIYAIKQTKKYR